MKDLIIRNIREEDFISYRQLIKECFSHEIMENNFLNMINDKNYKILIGEVNGKLVANLILKTEFNYIKNLKHSKVHYVCVKEEYRNNKIGTKMIDYVINSVGNDIEFIELTSRPEREFANRIYLKAGFKIKNTNIYRKYFK